MQSVNGLSLAPRVNAWLANTHRPGILHIFDGACNLINERREVLSIVTPQIGDGPFNLVIEDDICFFEHLNIASPISIHNNQLTLGDVIVDTVEAKLWSPRLNWKVIHAKRENIFDQLSSLPTIRPLLPNHLISSLSYALANADLSSCLIAAKQLAGLGNGLTPSGDDFIMGAIYATWIIHPPEIAGPLAREITNTAAPLTTSLSAAWLRSAGRGEAGILWHQFLDTLISAHPVNIQEAMDKILAVGETSGADALAGFIRLFVYWGEYCSNLWEYNQA